MTTTNWNVSASGDWSDASDWSGGVPNSSSDDAVIAQSGTYTITVGSSERFTVGSVTLNDTNATLQVNGALNLSDTLTLTAGTLNLTGTINGGTIDTGGGTFIANDGTLNGATVDGTVNLTNTSNNDYNQILAISGDVSFSGAAQINLTGYEATLFLNPSSTLSNVTINAGNNTVDQVIVGAFGSTGTLASSVIIDVANGAVGVDIGGPGNPGGALIDNGTINDTASNATLWISESSFTNAGTINVANGNTLNIGAGTFVNTGTIGVDGTSTIEYEASTTTADLGTINAATGATLYFAGGLDNVGAVYTPVSGVVLAGTIEGGAIEGTLNISDQTPPEILILTGDLSFEGAGGVGSGTINVTADQSTLYIDGAATLHNVTINLGNGGISGIENGGTITFGSDVTISQTGSDTQASIGQWDDFVNDGKIDAAAPNGSDFTIAYDFTNAGTIAVTNGDTLAINTLYFTNTGTITVDGSSEIAFIQGISTPQLGTIETANGAVLNFLGEGFEYGSGLNNVGSTFVIPTGALLSGLIAGGTVEGTVNIADLPSNPDYTVGLYFEGNTTFEGAGGSGPGIINDNGALVFEATVSDYNATISDATIIPDGGGLYINRLSIVTFASNVSIDQTSPDNTATVEAVPNQYDVAPNSLINDGSIVAASSGGSFAIEGLTFTNAGSIAVSNGDTLTISEETGTYIDPASFSNTGTITVDGSSTLDLDVNMTTAQLGNFEFAVGANIEFGDTLSGGNVLNNTDATLVLPNPINVSGTIEGGTIEGVMDLGVANAILDIEGGLATLGSNGSGRGAIDITGASAELVFYGSQSLTNAVVNIGAAGSDGNVISNSGGTLTLSSSVTLEQSEANTAAYLGYDENIGVGSTTGAVINDGTIISGASDAAFGIDPETFTNNGLIEAINGGEIVLGPYDFTNLSNNTLTGGTYEAGAGSSFELITTEGLYTDDGTIILNGATSAFVLDNPTSGNQQTIENALGGVGQGGALEILGGRNWNSTAPFTNSGTIQLGGGTFTVASLANSGTLSGFGTFDTAITNSGSFALVAFGGTLSFDGSFSGLSGPTLASGVTLWAFGGSTLQLPSGLSFTSTDGTVVFGGTGAVIQSLNGSNEVSLMSTLVNIGTTGALEVVGNDNFTSSNAIVNDGTIQLGGGTFSTGTLTNSSGATLKGFGTVAAVLDDSGTITSIGGTLEFTASGNVLAGAIGGVEVEFNGGSDSLQSGTSLTAATIAINSSASLTLGSNLSFAGTLDLASGVIAAGANTLTLAGTGSAIDGTVSGTGTLALKGGSQTIGSGAVLSVSSIGITSSDAVTIAANASYGGSLSVAAGTTITVDTGDTLTLSGTTTLNGTIGGTGTLSLGGGTLFADSGAVLSTNQLVLGGTATLGLKESLTFAGVVSDATGTSIAIGTGLTLTLTGTGSTLDGTVTGKGTLLLDGGTDTLKGATMQVSDWTLSDGATATFGTDITYGGVLTEEAGTTLSLGSKALNLTGGASDFAGAITGTAALNLKGGSQEFDAGATISTAHWNLTGKDAGTIDGDLTYAGAFSSGNGTKIAISAGDTLDLTGAAAISSKVSGAGTLELSGGTDVLGRGVGVTIGTLELVNNASVSVDAVIKDTGALSIDATSSLAIDSHKAFDLTAAATGSGTFVIDANATLEFSSTVASTLTANFDGADAILKLADISGFGATISGFAVGDTIDLMHRGANSAVLDGNELVVKHNATVVATLQLSGDYTGYTFETSSDGHSGTDITLIAPPEGNSGLHIVANTFSPDWHLG